MTMQEQMLAHMDQQIREMLTHQQSDGSVIRKDSDTDTRYCGFCLAGMLTCYAHPSSCFASGEARETLERGLHSVMRYLAKQARESGMFDLASCNFDSAPDTAFTVNALLDCAHVLKTSTMPGTGEALEALLPIILRACDGICEGGFHTPNHRWAIAACLMDAAAFTSDVSQAKRFRGAASRYLAEGLDISEDGEFAERSSGTYNAVNDDQMLRLFLTTGDRQYLEAARRNLIMMLSYLEPDGSIFTFHSTRQDHGQRVWPGGYFWLYALCGYLSEDPALAAFAMPAWETAMAHGETPRGLIQFMRFPELEAYIGKVPADRSRIAHYAHLFSHSGIARMREGNFSVSILAGKPDFLYVTSGDIGLCMSLYANVCDKRNFVSEGIEEVSKGHFRLRCRMESWYYLPYDPGECDTQDWWEMDSANTRKKQVRDSLEITVDLIRTADGKGLEITVETAGLSKVPLRLELGIAGQEIRSESFVIPCIPGAGMTVCAGNLEVHGAGEDVLTIGPCFASHNVLSAMGGAFRHSADRFVVNLTDHTPCTHTITLGSAPIFPDRL
ncbi:MAG: hypothetical protein IJ229_09180 [Clostridia bacterium]|nr:hypothetical protein [Clostridia bacterium]MBR1684862.1 hypothetical protein [Clostridia bacterium]MBR2287659.1 hypothetical protein [Clostridia bacterium]